MFFINCRSIKSGGYASLYRTNNGYAVVVYKETTVGQTHHFNTRASASAWRETIA